jgi:hypothetical protein
MNFARVLEEEGMEPAEVVTVTAPTLTLAAVRSQFSEYLVKVNGMVRDAEALEVNDEDRLKFAVALGGEAAKISKRIDAKRKDVTAEASDFVKAVNGFCKDYMDRLADVVTITKKKISSYQYQQELERRKQEEAARKAAEELQAKLKAEAEEANRKAREEARKKAEEEARAKKASEAEIEAARKKAEEEAAKHEIAAPTVVAPVMPAQEKVTRTETGAAAHIRKVWKAEILSAADIPREYCSPDIKKINDAIKMGVREIPGVRIYEDQTTVFRT